VSSSRPMAEPRSANFGHLANLLFDRAASLWYRSLAIEVVAAVAAGVLAFVNLTDVAAVVASLALVALLLVAYAMRLLSQDKDETAQTMRRQAALSEGLGWPIEPTQAEEWRRKVGADIRQKASSKPRADDYYTSAESASPRRMAEMTRESSFYTRHLWIAVRNWLVVGFVAVGGLLAAVVIAALLDSSEPGADLVVAQVVSTAALLAITVDALGWSVRLTRKSNAVKEVERGLDRVLAQSDISETDVLRLLSEYDCELATSFPIHPWIFRRKHDEIRELWEHHWTG